MIMSAILVMYMIMTAISTMFMMMIMSTAGTIRRVFMMVVPVRMTLSREQVKNRAARTHRHGAGTHKT